MKHKIRDISLIKLVNGELNLKDYKRVTISDGLTEIILINMGKTEKGNIINECWLKHIEQPIKISVTAVIDYLMTKESTYSMIDVEY